MKVRNTSSPGYPIIIRSTKGNALTLVKGEAKAARGDCIPQFEMECRQEGKTQVRSTARKGMRVIRQLWGPKGQKCVVTETFTPTKNSIRWEAAVACDNSKPWSTSLIFRLKYPATAKTRFWTSWLDGAPNEDSQLLPGRKLLPGQRAPWNDPLVIKPLLPFVWKFGDGICIPIATFLEPEADFGVSLAVSPAQPIVRLALKTEPDGLVQFQHEAVRLGENRTVKFTADLVPHEADWRGGLRWIVNRYPDFFNPANPKADEMVGTGSYSRYRGKLDKEKVARLKKMAYRVNWAASFDFPYMGMFLPPMPNADATWKTAGNDTGGNLDRKLAVTRSYRQMNDSCRYLKENGFHQFSYFNVTEFGSQIGKPDAVKKDLPEEESWKDANTMLYRKFPKAICKSRNDDSIETWSGAVVMDPADPAFKAHLLEMAKRLIVNLPNTAGIIIDRMDWLVREVNYGADDGITWDQEERPGRLLALSWNSFMPDLAKLIHSHGKVVFGNPSKTNRLDVVRELDGFFDEYGHHALFMSGTSLLALRKPVIVWTHDNSIGTDPDNYFQRHLYMGAYPMAPVEDNDHSILPSPTSDQPYFDYGPLLNAMRGKKWVLEPHCIEVAKDAAKVNLFSVFDGWVAPVVFGPKDGMVTVLIRNVPGIAGNLDVEAILPGIEKPLSVSMKIKEGSLELKVPVHCGCAMVTIRKKLKR